MCSTFNDCANTLEEKRDKRKHENTLKTLLYILQKKKDVLECQQWWKKG